MTKSIERIFLGWSDPALQAAAALLVRQHTRDGEVRMDRAVVVLPGARAGRRLTELLVTQAERRGLRLLPPRTTTVGLLPELLYEPQRPLADSVLARRVWAHTLRSLEPARLLDVFPRPPQPDDLTHWHALARQVERLHRELSGARLAFHQVVARCRDGLLFDDGERWAVLAQVQDAYLARLHALGRDDRDRARQVALDRGPVVMDQQIWLVGVVEMPAVVRALLEAAAAPVRALVHAPPERAADFDDAGCVRPESWLGAEIPIRDERLRMADRPGDQATQVVRAIAALDGRFTADEITIGVPDEQVVPHLEQRLAAAQLPGRYAAGIPVARTGPFRLLAAVAAFLDGRRSDAFAALLRHPDLARWLRRRGRERRPGDPLREADAWPGSVARHHCDSLPAHYAGPVAGSGQPRAAVEAALRALDTDEFLVRVQGRRRLVEWAPRILDLLVEIYGHEPLDRNRSVERDIIEACARIRTAAAGFHRLPEAVDDVCDGATAIRLVIAEAEGVTIPEEPDRAAVEMLGWLELHLDDAPALVVSGMNDARVPETLTADAFLPNALRTRLGLPDNDLRHARDAYLLTAMVRSRSELVLITGRHDATGDPLRPSRLLFAATARTVAERVRRFFSGQAEPERQPEPEREHEPTRGPERELNPDLKPEPGLAPTRGPERQLNPDLKPERKPRAEREHARDLEPERTGEDSARAARKDDGDLRAAAGEVVGGFRLPPELVLQAPEPIASVRITDLSSLIEDPYRFALERVLRLESLDDHAREMDGRLFGNLAHAVLHRFGESDEAARAEPAPIRRGLDALLDDEAGRRFGRHAFSPVKVQVEQLRARLHAFADWHARRVDDGWRVVATEAAPPSGSVALEVDGEPVLLRGRIDRIDHHPATGAWCIFDYKTSDAGKSPEATHRKVTDGTARWIGLQLPLYRRLAMALQTADGAPLIPPGQEGAVRLGYILLPRDPADVGAVLAEWTPDELLSADEAARDAVRLLRRNRFVFDPEHTKVWPGSGLGRLVGLGQLATATDGADDAGGEG